MKTVFPETSAFLRSHSLKRKKRKLAMTESRKARRAETARQNGAKSRGPKTPNGKFISSLNAITTAEHLEIFKAEMPECAALLSTDNSNELVALLQKLIRQFLPQSECELTLVRQACVEMFQYQRTVSLETFARQCDLDGLLRRCPEMSPQMRQYQSYKAGLAEDKLWRSLQRDKKAHLSAFSTFQKQIRLMRRDFAMNPVEPVCVDPDLALLNQVLPPPEVVAEILAHADRAKNEPSYKLPLWVAEVLDNKELMAEIAPDYKFQKSDEVLDPDPVPEAV